MKQQLPAYFVSVVFVVLSSSFIVRDATAARAPGTFSLIVNGPATRASLAVQPTPLSTAHRANRWRCIDIQPALASPDGLIPGDTLLLDLFADATYTAVIDQVSTNVNGTVTVRGRIVDSPFGYVIISTTAGRSLGFIEVPENGKHYLIQQDAHAPTHMLMDVDPKSLEKLDDAPSPIAPGPAPDSTTTASHFEKADGPTDLDIMIVYTPAARVWADEFGGGIANVVAQAMAFSQLVLDNSNCQSRVNLVYSGETDYTESGSSAMDLGYLTYYDRFGHPNHGPPILMDEVHDLRDEYQADLVCLFACVEDVGGVGWLLTYPLGDPESAFCLVRVQQAAWTYTQIHETGHNMGCHHHKQQLREPGPGLFPDSAGWRWTGYDGGQYCSIMTYESGYYFPDGINHLAVPYLSNPLISYQNMSTGEVDDANNARAFCATKTAVAGYRVPLAEALDQRGDWTTGGDRLWYGQTGKCHDGHDAAMTHPLVPGQETWLQTTVRGPASLSFSWELYPITEQDPLEFYLDDVLQFSVHGQIVELRSVDVPEGTHTIRWRYAKNSSGDFAYDYALVDKVVVTSSVDMPAVSCWGILMMIITILALRLKQQKGSWF